MMDSVMTDIDTSPAMGVRADTTSMQCDNGYTEITQFAPVNSLMAITNKSSWHNPKEMEGALRIMNHAGRILWRAAMSSLSQGTGSYNPPLDVLSKLFRRSSGKSKSSNDQTKRSEYSLWKAKVCEQDESHCVLVDELSSKDCSDINDEILSGSNKRKLLFGISARMPASHYETEDGSNRGSKHPRCSFGFDALGRGWRSFTK